MSESHGDPLMGLLTDIAEGVAALTVRFDAMETEAAAHQAQVIEALATIAEIATRTYYVSKPTSALPGDVINSAVMNPMIERWPAEWPMTFPPSEFKIFNNLASVSTVEIEALLRARAVIAEDATNAQRLRHAWALFMLNEEMTKRFEAHEQGQKRDAPGRSR